MTDPSRPMGEQPNRAPQQSPIGQRNKLTIPTVVALVILILLFNMLSALPGGTFSLSLYTVISSAAIGILFACTTNKLLHLILPLSFVLALLFCLDPLSALNALLAFPGGYALSLALLKKKSKTSAVVSMTVLTFSVWIMVLLVQLMPSLSESGSLIELIKNTVSSLPDSLRSLFLEPLNTPGLTVTEEQRLALVASVETMIPLLMSSLPAMVILSLLSVSYLSASFAACLIKGLCPARLPSRPWGISLSSVSAGLYLLSFVGYAFASLFSGGVGVFYALTLNFVLILLPGFAIVGAKALLLRIRHMEAGGSRTILIVFLIFFFFFNFYYLLYLTAIYGAISTLKLSLSKFLPR